MEYSATIVIIQNKVTLEAGMHGGGTGIRTLASCCWRSASRGYMSLLDNLKVKNRRVSIKSIII